MCGASADSFQLLQFVIVAFTTLQKHLPYIIASAHVLRSNAVAHQHQHLLNQGDANPIEQYVRRLEICLVAPQWREFAFKQSNLIAHNLLIVTSEV